jgi:hypothetical protein
MGLFDFLRLTHKPSLATAADGRYDGHPRTLAPDKEQLVTSMTQRIFGGGADWRDTLRTTLHLGESLDDSLRQMWADH